MVAAENASHSRSRIRDGLVMALLVMAAAIGIRFLVSDPIDNAHFEGLANVTGIDFGEWPQFFHAGGGGDGEIFAVMATDPLGRGPGNQIAAAAYRYSRIGFPLLAWMISFGQSQLVLPALVTIGLLSVAGVGFIVGYMREPSGWPILLLIVNPALYIGFIGDTAEPLALLVLALVFTSSRPWAGMALAAIRPTYMTAVVSKWRPLLAGTVVAVVVRILAVSQLGNDDIGQLGDVFALPFSGYVAEPSLAGFLLAAAALSTFVIGIKSRDLAWVASSLFVLVFGSVILADPINAVRAAAVLPVLWAFGPSQSDLVVLIKRHLGRSRTAAA